MQDFIQAALGLLAGQMTAHADVAALAVAA
jgi:hypothetical protein